MDKASKRSIEEVCEMCCLYPHCGMIECPSQCVSSGHFIDGYRCEEKDIIYIIESRISEIVGDAQPNPTLRAELRDLINKLKEEKK